MYRRIRDSWFSHVLYYFIDLLSLIYLQYFCYSLQCLPKSLSSVLHSIIPSSFPVSISSGSSSPVPKLPSLSCPCVGSLLTSFPARWSCDLHIRTQYKHSQLPEKTPSRPKREKFLRSDSRLSQKMEKTKSRTSGLSVRVQTGGRECHAGRLCGRPAPQCLLQSPPILD